MPSKKASPKSSPKSKAGTSKPVASDSKMTMPSRKVMIEASLSVLGLATAAAIIFVPSIRSSDAAPSTGANSQSSSWTDLEGGPDSTEELKPASKAALADASRRTIGDP